MLRRNLPRSRSDLARLAVLAVFGVVSNQVCFVEGLFRTTPIHSSLLNTTIPVWTLLLAVILGREPLEPRRLSALVVSLAGVLLVIRPDASAWESGLLAGDLLTLANGVSYAVFLVLSKRLLMRTDAVGATALLLTFGAIGVLPLGLPQLAALHLLVEPMVEVHRGLERELGVVVGVQRFDQHKAGIRAAGSVLKRGLEVLTGPVLHLQRIKRAQAAEIEEGLAEALRAAGLFVQGGH